MKSGGFHLKSGRFHLKSSRFHEIWQISVWGVHGGGYDPRFHEIQGHSPSPAFIKLNSFCWNIWIYKVLGGFHLKSARFHLRSTGFHEIRQISCGFNEIRRISCEIERPLARNCNPMFMSCCGLAWCIFWWAGRILHGWRTPQEQPLQSLISGGSKGVHSTPPKGPNSFILTYKFMKFSRVRSWRLPRGWRPSFGKSATTCLGPLADLHWQRSGSPPPRGSRFFRFDIQNFQNVTASGVHAPLRGPHPPTGNPGSATGDQCTTISGATLNQTERILHWFVTKKSRFFTSALLGKSPSEAGPVNWCQRKPAYSLLDKGFSFSIKVMVCALNSIGSLQFSQTIIK